MDQEYGAKDYQMRMNKKSNMAAASMAAKMAAYMAPQQKHKI